MDTGNTKNNFLIPPLETAHKSIALNHSSDFVYWSSSLVQNASEFQLRWRLLSTAAKRSITQCKRHLM
jgi:hypothetical protein